MEFIFGLFSSAVRETQLAKAPITSANPLLYSLTSLPSLPTLFSPLESPISASPSPPLESPIPT